MADRGIRVTAVDLQTGQRAEQVIQPGNYAIIAAAPCYLAGEQHESNGTTVLTLKGRDRSLLATSEVPPSGGDGRG